MYLEPMQTKNMEKILFRRKCLKNSDVSSISSPAELKIATYVSNLQEFYEIHYCFLLVTNVKIFIVRPIYNFLALF